MRNLNTCGICFSVFTTIADHIEIGPRIPRWLSMAAQGAFSGTAVHFVLPEIKGLEGVMMI